MPPTTLHPDPALVPSARGAVEVREAMEAWDGGARLHHNRRSRRLRTSFRRGFLIAALLLASLMLARVAFTQAGLGPMMFTVGTTTQDGAGRQWAYLLWQGTDPALIQGHTFAVYGKAGDPPSTNAYTRRAIVALQTDPTLIQVLLTRGVNVGDDLVALENDINSLFQTIMPSGSLTLPQKVSAVIRGSTNAQYFGNLIHLSRLHPGLSFCLGFAHAEMIGSSNTTFEIREFDLQKGQDLAVAGRVTVTAGAPLVLPATGPPVEVVTPNPQGHLNLKLRWALPDALRRVALLNYGFNVYRMTRVYAEAHNYHVMPPDTATLRALANASIPAVKRINRLPILTSKDYDAVSVLDFTADPTTFFTADDNGRFKPGGVPFNNGAQFYYFVTARDVLGRDGVVSPGALMTACDRMPPSVPAGVQVVNWYTNDPGGPHQWLKISWKQNSNSNADDVTASYHVYRWTNVNDIHVHAGSPAFNRIATVAHVNGQTNDSYIDNGAGSPGLGTDAGRTFWYTVRAADVGACGTNFSGNSPPIFGVLRDRAGPAPPGGYITFQCTQPTVSFAGLVQANLPPNTYRLICTRLDEGIVQATFYLGQVSPYSLMCQAPFAPGETQAVCYIVTTNPAPLWCVVSDTKGQTASAVYSDFFSGIREYHFVARTLAYPVHADPAGGGCIGHDPAPAGGTNVAPICLTLSPDAKTREMKVYRRVDGGPLTLVRQLEVTSPLPIDLCDSAMPANPAEYCYYAQSFDVNGNPSPLVRVAGCLEVIGLAELPKPLLSPIDPQGTETNATMKLTWFCAPHGVQRFKVWIALEDSSDDPGVVSSQLSSNTVPGFQWAKVVIGNGTNTYKFAVYETPLIGPAFGTGGAQFSVQATATIGKSYVVFIQSCGAAGTTSKPGNAEKFLWNPPRAVQPQVPWPARGLPAVNAKFTLAASNLFHAAVGVVIGTGTFIGSSSYNGHAMIPGFYGDPTTFVTTTYTAGAPLFPVVLYRQQVPSTDFPVVGGDVIQVSPMMEQIAYGLTANGTVIYDPFVVFLAFSDIAIVPPTLFLLDSQPAVLGARYRYYLMRFKSNGEPDQVFVTNDVDVN